MTYYKYWGLNRPPFDNVPDPRMYWPQNPTLEDAISEILFSITEGNECLAVIVGEIGTGKTLALRVLLNELSPEKYKVAFLTNPTLTFTQIMREIIGQLEDKKILIKWKDHLQEEFNRILYKSADEGKRVVVFIDEANVLTTGSLQGLRLLTNMQDDNQNLVTFVLAGQKELAKKLERPSMENLYQRIGVYCKVKGLDSLGKVAEYVAHRLKHARQGASTTRPDASATGCSREIFTEPAIMAVWNHSRGVPRMVNKICKLCLKAGETNHMKVIDESVVEGLACMFVKGCFKKDKADQEKEVPAAHMDAGYEVSDKAQRGEQKKENLASLELSVRSVATVALNDSPSLNPSVVGPSQVADEARETGAECAPATECVKIKESGVQTNGANAGDKEQESFAMDDLVKHLPSEILNRIYYMEERQLCRLAGQLAATELRRNEALKRNEDPIVLWEKIRSEIIVVLKRLGLQNVGQATGCL